MARYAVSRVRSLTGLGRTFSFVPRLRGLGDDAPIITPDFGPAPVIAVPQPTAPSVSPIDTTMIDAGDTLQTPFDFTPSRPIIPSQKITPVTAPDISAGVPGGPLQLPKIVFPSGGTVRPAVAPQPSVSWLDQQTISGIPNSYLALGAVGAVILFSLMGAKRRR